MVHIILYGSYSLKGQKYFPVFCQQTACLWFQFLSVCASSLEVQDLNRPPEVAPEDNEKEGAEDGKFEIFLTSDLRTPKTRTARTSTSCGDLIFKRILNIGDA